MLHPEHVVELTYENVMKQSYAGSTQKRCLQETRTYFLGTYCPGRDIFMISRFFFWYVRFEYAGLCF